MSGAPPPGRDRGGVAYSLWAEPGVRPRGGVGGAVQRPRGRGGLPGPARGSPRPAPPNAALRAGGRRVDSFLPFLIWFKVLFLPRAGFGGLRPQPGRTCCRPGGWGGSKKGAGDGPGGVPAGRGLRGFLGAGGPRPEGRQRPSPPRGWPEGLPRFPPAPSLRSRCRCHR